jgi:hypothetical protein
MLEVMKVATEYASNPPLIRERLFSLHPIPDGSEATWKLIEESATSEVNRALNAWYYSDC